MLPGQAQQEGKTGAGSIIVSSSALPERHGSRSTFSIPRVAMLPVRPNHLERLRNTPGAPAERQAPVELAFKTTSPQQTPAQTWAEVTRRAHFAPVWGFREGPAMDGKSDPEGGFYYSRIRVCTFRGSSTREPAAEIVSAPDLLTPTQSGHDSERRRTPPRRKPDSVSNEGGQNEEMFGMVSTFIRNGVRVHRNRTRRGQ